METSSISTSVPLRIAIAGLGRTGLHHLEELSLRDDCRVVAAGDVDATRGARASDFGCRFHTNWPELLADPAVDLVLIATAAETRAALVVASLEAGKHVALTPPFGTSLAEVDQMLAAAEESQRALIALSNRRYDDDFHQALAVARSGAVGELLAVKSIVWDYAVPTRRPSRNTATPNGERDGALWRFGVDAFDQLLTLVADEPRSVYCMTVPSKAAHAELDESFVTVVTFSQGVTAQVEVHLASPVRFRSGWIVTGTRGGYRKSRQSELTEEGEIFETPVELPSTAASGLGDDLLRACRGEGPPRGSARAVRNLMVLVEAARASARTGQVVHLSPSAKG